jgi:TRAP-type C4-dicarboxylate transport system permease large subunit
VLLGVLRGISGSSTADAASQGKIFIEAQVKEGDLSFRSRSRQCPRCSQ